MTNRELLMEIAKPKWLKHVIVLVIISITTKNKIIIWAMLCRFKTYLVLYLWICY